MFAGGVLDLCRLVGVSRRAIRKFAAAGNHNSVHITHMHWDLAHRLRWEGEDWASYPDLGSYGGAVAPIATESD